MPPLLLPETRQHILLVLMMLLGILTGCGDVHDSNKPLEYKLAVINANGIVAEDDITVTRFRYLLDTLEIKSGYSRQQIGDMTVSAQELIRSEYGKDITVLDLMEKANSAMSTGTDLNYKEVLALIAVSYGQ